MFGPILRSGFIWFQVPASAAATAPIASAFRLHVGCFGLEPALLICARPLSFNVVTIAGSVESESAPPAPGPPAFVDAARCHQRDSANKRYVQKRQSNAMHLELLKNVTLNTAAAFCTHELKFSSTSRHRTLAHQQCHWSGASPAAYLETWSAWQLYMRVFGTVPDGGTDFSGGGTEVASLTSDGAFRWIRNPYLLRWRH